MFAPRGHRSGGEPARYWRSSKACKNDHLQQPGQGTMSHVHEPRGSKLAQALSAGSVDIGVVHILPGDSHI